MTGPQAITGAGTVCWADTDASGWIHFTAPFRWVEEVEHAFYRDAGADPGRFPRRAVSADYARPLRAGDRYAVTLVPERVGTTSITWTWSVENLSQPSDRPAVSGNFVVVHLDDKGRPGPLPSSVTTRVSVSLEA